MKTTDPSILIIEDSETQAVLLASILETKGWQTHCCDTAEKALESISERTYSLIVVDFHLPGMNGDQFCRNIKMDINTRSIPVLMFTIEGSPESENAALESGADYFASKEMDKELLVAKIDSILAQSKNLGFRDKESTSFHQSRILAVDDSPTFLMFLVESFKTEGITLDTAESGEIALKLIETTDYDCILLDLVMPVMDGIAVCKAISKIKSQERRPLFVMMLTAHENKTEMMRALEAGADDFVGKSNDISIIKARLSALLRRRYIQMDNQRIWRKLKENELKAERARIENEAAQAKALLTEQLQKTVTQLEKEIKERERISEELQQAKEDAEKASRTKSEFLSNMSHELRSPLNSMLILSQLLMENSTGNLTDEQVESAKIVNASGRDLLTMINDLLDLSKVEAAKMELQPQRFNLKTFIEEIKTKFQVQADQKNINFITEIDEDLPADITSDPQRLSQIIRNLLSNAFKFTDTGEVKLGVTRPLPDTDLNQSNLRHDQSLLFYVSDTGIGIPESKMILIFQSFTQADGSTSRKYGGTGLGLTLSKEFSRFLGGEIQVESKEGKGSKFHVFLPIHLQTAHLVNGNQIKENSQGIPTGEGGLSMGNQNSPSTERPVATARKKGPPVLPDQILNGLKILLVDDDMRNAFSLMKLFRNYNITTVIGENGRKGLEKLAEHPDVSLILMDIMMPVMDGYEAVAAIRSQDDFKNLPIIAVTAKAMTGDRERCLKAGATEYLAKPIEIDALMAMMKQLLAPAVS
jgi:two-component system sensor histidine kinase/response regulator